VNPIREECKTREITRIFHFTLSANMAHLFDDGVGLCPTADLKKLDFPYNPTDLNRYDGFESHVCCSIEYPNVFYFAASRGRYPLFPDWVVLSVSPSRLWHEETLFCPCNAATGRGAHIQGGIDGFRALYAPDPPGSGDSRTPNHLIPAPIDIQSEVLLSGPIPLDSITGVIVESAEQARRELLRLELQGITFNLPITIAPHFFNKSLADMIRRGRVGAMKEETFCG